MQFSLNFAVDATHLNKIGALSARTGECLGGGHVPQRLTRYKLAATYVPKGKSSAVMVESEPLQMLAFTFLKFSFESSKKKCGRGKKHQFSSETSRRMSRNIHKAFVLLQFLKSCVKSASGGVKSVFFCLFFAKVRK